MRKLRWCLGLLLLCAGPAAAVQSTVVTPAASNVPVGEGGRVSLEWTIQTNQPLGTGVSSPQGTFRAGGANGSVLGTLNRAIQGAANTVVNANTRAATIRETVEVPRQIVLRAQARSSDRIVFVRTFDDGGPPNPPNDTAGSTFALTGGFASQFRVSRVSLRFEDGSVQRVVAPSARTWVTASISFSGSGRLEGRWEIADPSSTRGEPRFRSIGVVRRPFIGAGREITLRSPDLPTRVDGIHLVRLRITNPQPAFDPPELGYAVNAALAPPAEPVTIERVSPAGGATWAPDTRFQWEPVRGASNYRLEFREQSGDGDAEAAAPVSGILVTAPVEDTELTRVALSHLPPGHTYWWRVVAFDGQGRLIGRSRSRRLRIPQASGGG